MDDEAYKKFVDLKNNNQLLDPKLPAKAIANLCFKKIPSDFQMH